MNLNLEEEVYIINPAPFGHLSMYQDILTDENNGRPQPKKVKNLQPLKERLYNVGRNQPCPCKSGKKFKTCCLGK